VTKLVGASVWEEELYEHLTAHESNEQETLEEYRQAAAASGSAAFLYLANLIVEDEKRHHRIFEDLASALRTDAELRSEQPAIPRLDNWGTNPAHVVELTERLMEREREDAKSFHRLDRELKDVRDTTLWGLLMKMMEMDTAKHLEILEFVQKHARKAAGR
jgi:rubrerythrin